MKMKKMLSIALSLISAFSIASIAGCDNKEEDSQTNAAEMSKVVTLADFEEFNPDFQLLRLQNGFGRVDVNKDANFVKSGEASAMLRPLGRYKDKANPFLYFELESELYDYSYSDLKYLYSASMWIYNDEDETKSVEIGIVTHLTSLRDEDGAKQAGGLKYSLKAGWNKITYFVNRDEIIIPVGGTKVQGLYIQFDNVPSLDIEDAPTYYVDDVVLTVMTEFNDIVVEEPTYSPKQGETVTVPTATIKGGSVTYSVIHNNKVVPTNNDTFVPNDGGEFFIVYTASINGFVFKKTISIFVKPSDAVEVLSFKNADAVSSLLPRGQVEKVEWSEKFEGVDGVAKITINRDWPSVSFTPTKDIAAYQNCEYIVLRAYFVSGENQFTWISLCDTTRPERYYDRVELDRWYSYKIPIQTFFDNFDGNLFFVGNTTSYQVNGTFYISEIYAM